LQPGTARAVGSGGDGQGSSHQLADHHRTQVAAQPNDQPIGVATPFGTDRRQRRLDQVRYALSMYR